ncbi:hypothetical protein EH165_02305 [Nakamurella antarctica]|uniref:Uncharacterized protein n=1 Tax=Nakamurella antarctica TaxID=1902245 RepID=A0A3G8ZRN8_9ACTN|nr:hypothetical protein [Nakamurella antarctica]AZI57164.1 hypothetical protein EH165_02305 [Nakamurella antarctica]
MKPSPHRYYLDALTGADGTAAVRAPLAKTRVFPDPAAVSSPSGLVSTSVDAQAAKSHAEADSALVGPRMTASVPALPLATASAEQVAATYLAQHPAVVPRPIRQAAPRAPLLTSQTFGATQIPVVAQSVQNQVRPHAAPTQAYQNQVRPPASQAQAYQNQVRPPASQAQAYQNQVRPPASQAQAYQNQVRPPASQAQAYQNQVRPPASQAQAFQNRVERAAQVFQSAAAQQTGAFYSPQASAPAPPSYGSRAQSRAARPASPARTGARGKGSNFGFFLLLIIGFLVFSGTGRDIVEEILKLVNR